MLKCQQDTSQNEEKKDSKWSQLVGTGQSQWKISLPWRTMKFFLDQRKVYQERKESSWIMKDSDEGNRESEHIVIYMHHNVNEVCDMDVEVVGSEN